MRCSLRYTRHGVDHFGGDQVDICIAKVIEMLGNKLIIMIMIIIIIMKAMCLHRHTVMLEFRGVNRLIVFLPLYSVKRHPTLSSL